MAKYKRDLKADLGWLDNSQKRNDLSDKYLESIGQTTRVHYKEGAFDFKYGITFVESNIAREWLERAITAEGILNKQKEE